MRDYIKKLLNEGLLSEKLTMVDDDVDLIYDTYFKDDIEEINRTGIVTEKMFKYSLTDTSILKSEEAMRAHELNPCSIHINAGKNGYAPLTKDIYVSVNFGAFEFVLDFKGDLSIAAEKLPSGTHKNNFSKEFTLEKIKGSIHHELAHWIDDTFNNQHIEKRIQKQMSAGTSDLKNIPVNMTKFEIQAQIHNVKQLHNKYNDIWDSLSFMDMIKLSPALNVVYNQLNPEQLKQWTRDLKTRMYRENLLGKKMAN
jgi:hypothetical protein